MFIVDKMKSTVVGRVRRRSIKLSVQTHVLTFLVLKSQLIYKRTLCDRRAIYWAAYDDISSTVPKRNGINSVLIYTVFSGIQD